MRHTQLLQLRQRRSAAARIALIIKAQIQYVERLKICVLAAGLEPQRSVAIQQVAARIVCGCSCQVECALVHKLKP